MGMLMALAAIGTLGPLAEPLIRLWLSDRYAWLGPHLSIVLLSQVIALPSACASQALLGMGRAGVTFVVQASATASAIGALVLGLVFNMGFSALTLSLVAYLAARAAGSYLMCLILTKDSPLGFLWHGIARPMLICLPMGFAVWHVASRQDIRSWSGLLLGGALSLTAMLLACLAALPREDRSLLISILAASTRWMHRR
jgi:O-antigen/teichoic acid export membrane protein